MAKTERSFTNDELIDKIPGGGPVQPVSATKRVFRQSRSAAAGTNKVKAGLKKLAALGIR